MSYTPPLGDALAFAELGGSPSPPLGGAVNFVEGAGLAPPSVVLSAPLSVEIVPPPSVALSAPLRVQVAVAQALAGSLPVVLLDPDVLGGLDGSTASPGGWSAAPSGSWCAVVKVGPLDYSHRLTGQVLVRSEEDAARVAEFSILPASPLQPLELVGQPVSIYFAELRGGTPFAPQLIFSGFVDRPSVDASAGVLSLYCTDRAQYLCDRMGRDKILAALGAAYHAEVNGDPEGGYEFMLEVMRAERAAWALDSYRKLVRIEWEGAGDLATIRDADVISDSVSIDLPSGEGVLYSAQVTVELRCPVLRERTARARWAVDMTTLMTAGAEGSAVRWPLESMVRGAFEGVSGWTLVSPITITHPPAGVIWSAPGSGVFFIGDEAAASLALGGDATYRRRWVCESTREETTRVYVLQNKALNPTAPDGVERGASLVSELPDSEWASDLSILPVPSDGGAHERWQRWYSAGATDDDFEAVFGILRGQAVKELVQSARTSRVRASLPCRPALWLGSRVRLDTARVLAQGQIAAVEHVMDFDAGSALTHIELAVMPPVPPQPTPQAIGGGSDEMDPPDAAVGAFSFVAGGPYIGGLEHSPPWSEENVGFSTNSQIIYPGSQMYPYQFTMLAPDLSDLDLAPIPGKKIGNTNYVQYAPGILEIRS